VTTIRRGIKRAHLSDLRGDIFPALGLFIGCGAFAGAVIAVLDQGTGGLVVHVTSGTGLGAIAGLFIGLSKGVWRSLETLGPASPLITPDQLWDPWLDSGDDAEDVQPISDEADSPQAEPCTKVEKIDALLAKRAYVRPRVLSLETSEAIRLEDEIGRLIQEGRYDRVGLVGGPGSGKTTALQHLGAVLPPWALARVRFMDNPRGYADTVALGNGDALFVISAGSQLPADPRRQCYNLTHWNQDDFIEYLLAVYADRCASVMSRLKAAGDGDFIQGIPNFAPWRSTGWHAMNQLTAFTRRSHMRSKRGSPNIQMRGELLRISA
jgi:hypothetical protein